MSEPAPAIQAVLPGAIISGLFFLICAALYFFVRRIDAEERLRQGNPPRIQPGGVDSEWGRNPEGRRFIETEP